MAIGDNPATSRQLLTLLTLGTTRGLTDGQLLEHFCTSRGDPAELAFAALVDRHGPMVLRTCRAVLGNEPDAHDAFQATFLVLARRAHRLWIKDSLAPWIHEVAHRTATCARSANGRRRRLEARATEARTYSDPTREATLAEQSQVLHAELARLPDRDRAPLVLCDLEGQTHEQAARHLGWPIGTVKSRLTRARDRLKLRLIRRGLSPLVPLAVDLPVVPPSLLKSTVTLATRFAASRTLPLGLATTLTWEVLRAMTILRSLKAAAVLTLMTATATGVVHLALAGPSDGGQGQAESPKNEPSVARAEAKADTEVSVAKLGTLQPTLKARGIVEATAPISVDNPIAGISSIASIVPDGTRVKKGDVVGKLVNPTTEERLAALTREVKTADSGVAKSTLEREIAEIAVVEYRDGNYKAELEGLKAEVALAKSTLTLAEERLEVLKAVQQAGAKALAARTDPTPTDFLAKLELDDRAAEALPNLERAKSRFERAMTKLDILQKYSKRSVVKKLELEVFKAKITEDEAKSALESAEGKKKEAEARMEAGTVTLTAPADGRVFHSNDPNKISEGPTIGVGARVRERQLLFNIMRPDDPMRLNFKVPESIVDRVVLGQKVLVQIDAYSGQSVSAVIASVAPRPDPSTFNSDGRKVYTTLVKLEAGLDGLRPGMTAGTEISLGEKKNAVLIPILSVVNRKGKPHVAVKNPAGGFDWREVTTGLDDGEQIEIGPELKAGEIVSSQPTTLMSDEEKREADEATKPSRPSQRPSGRRPLSRPEQN
ncbi:sigma-70 family RNA polymerase sigma factor [Isosphaeraceae bacterium EP7]